MTFENSSSFILGFCTLFLAYYIAMAIRRARSNFPPGPNGLPILGYMPFLTKHKHIDFMELGKKYGDVFSVRLGSQDAVIIHGGDTVIESLNNPDLFGRLLLARSAKVKNRSIFFGNDFNSWKEQRKFVFKSMKDLGLGKTESEKDIIEEINHFMNFIRSCKAKPIDVKKVLLSCLINNMFALVLGKRFEYDSPELNLVCYQITEVFEHIVPVPLEMAFPWLLHIPSARKLFYSRKMRASNKECAFFLKKEITDHKITFDSTHVRDFIDRYLIEIETRREKNQETSFDHNMLFANVKELLNAGSEPVHSSLLWFIYIIAAFPKVQKEVQREIRNVIGSEKTPELKDMKNMPYTHAVLLESMRWKTVGPLGIPRYALNDTLVKGYIIPKGTVVLFNLWAVHHDPRYWDEPEKFKPERFLSSDGKSIVRTKYFMPFSRGGRGCPGESMAIMEMFLFCASILKEFSVAFPEGTEPTFKAKCGISYRLEPYLVRFIPKN